MTSTEPTLAHPYTEAGEGLDIPGLYNDTVQSFTWRDVTATIPTAGSKAEKTLLACVSGQASAGMRQSTLPPCLIPAVTVLLPTSVAKFVLS